MTGFKEYLKRANYRLYLLIKDEPSYFSAIEKLTKNAPAEMIQLIEYWTRYHGE